MKTLDLFLKNWQQTNLIYYRNLAQEYRFLRDKKQALMEKYDLYVTRPNEVQPEDYVEVKDQLNNFNLNLTKQTFAIVQSSVFYKRGIEEYLTTLLAGEVIKKKAILLAKIDKKVGKVLDASSLRIGDDGNINGVIVGEDASATVKTTLSGGYNVQCLHYRVLIKVIK